MPLLRRETFEAGAFHVRRPLRQHALFGSALLPKRPVHEPGHVRHEHELSVPESAVNLWELCDLATPWCLFTVATLRIAERMAEGIAEVEALAREAECNAELLNHVLGHLAAKGIFETMAPGRYALNDAARGLLDPALRLALDLNGIGGRMAYAWGTLPSYVRAGRCAYREQFGRSFWEDLEAHPQIAASFDALIGPAGHGAFSADFEIAGGWDSVRTVVDVGGGTGAMLAAMLRAHPHLRGTLVDLPRTVERSAETFQAAGVADRVMPVAQSFFDPLPAGADLYLLRGVLHDWDDPEAIALLKRCAEAARPSGRVVVLKSVGPDGTLPNLSVSMVLVGGKDRTVSEFRELAAQSGLEVVSAGRQPNYFVVECRPA
jgi:2,7-dihydroxy-5-methyl-1-naphthoate 7-O-methyltransferase